MSVTIPDAATAAVLARTVGTRVKLYGPDGQLLGVFTPASRPGLEFPEFGASLEEMNRRLHDPNARWVTGEAVMERLRSLRDAH